MRDTPLPAALSVVCPECRAAVTAPCTERDGNGMHCIPKPHLARITKAAPPPSRRAIESCGICSSLLCPHGLCRTCTACHECQERLQQLPAPDAPPAVRPEDSPFVPTIRLASNCVSRNRSDIASRAEWFAGMQLPRQDWPEASAALDERTGDLCQCGNWKKPNIAFCFDCHASLPASLHAGLKKHLKYGYLKAYRAAIAVLNPPSQRMPTFDQPGERSEPEGPDPFTVTYDESSGDNLDESQSTPLRCTPRYPNSSAGTPPPDGAA